MGVELALGTVGALARSHDTLDDAGQELNSASLSASLYWLTQTSALAYPGAKAVDPPGTAKFPQWKFALPSLAILALGDALERRRLRLLRDIGNPPDAAPRRQHAGESWARRAP